MPSERRRVLLGLAGIVLLALLWWVQRGEEAEPQPVDPHSGLSWVEEQDLPPEAGDTLELIDSGGPFPHREDGSVFQNRERLLPAEDMGYYREYTVETPGESDRGARRIVSGSDGELYWTEDHYASFERIRR